MDGRESRLDDALRSSAKHVPSLRADRCGRQAVRRMARYLARRGLLGGDGVDSGEGDDGETEPTLAQGHAALCASAASGQSPPAGPELRRRGTHLAPLVGKPLAFDKPNDDSEPPRAEQSR